ncbi:LPXTG cell wall anchor domain-containing protein [Streptomyces sp. NPDC051173]|uniref:LPXTG cell wall anchor domain-containing protein n=1 Tax=Streptomyces sp. NPDC051173 TaxID=3155164 RepID=UPI00344CD061
MSHIQRRPTRRTGALALAATVAGGTALLLAAPAAHADTVDVDYQCKTPIGDKSAVSPIDIKGVASGDSYKLTMSFEKGVSSSPVPLGKGAMKPSAVVKLGGADSGTVAVEGPANSEEIPANTPIKISDLSGTYTPKKSGTVTFTASTLTISALGTTTTCTPSNNPKPSLTLEVKAGGSSTGGSTTGGSTTGGSTTGGSGGTGGSGSTGGSAASGGSTGGGQLPQTGPADSAVALGTLGGTVLLTGVAGALWLTRRRGAAR